MASLPFAYWRGDMQYMFYITASRFHSGRLRFVYFPGNSAPSFTDWDASSRVVSVAGSTSVKFAIPTVMPSVWSQESCGNLCAYVLSPLLANESAAPSSVTVSIFVTCRNLEMAYPITRYVVPLYRCTEPPIAPFAAADNAEEFTAQASLRDEFAAPFDALAPEMRSVTFGQVNFNMQPALRSLASRPSSWFPAAAVTFGVADIVLRLFPSLALSTYVVAPLGALSSSVAGEMPSALNHFASAYQWASGGMRVKFSPPATGQSIVTVAECYDITAFAPTSRRVGAVLRTRPLPTVDTSLPVAFFDGSVSHRVEVETAFNVPQLALALGRPRHKFPPDLVVSSQSADAVPSPCWVAPADDFTMYGIRGVRVSIVIQSTPAGLYSTSRDAWDLYVPLN